MSPVLFTIGNISIKGYGTMMALGVLAAVLITMYRGKKRGFSQDAILDIALYGVLGGLVGAKLLYVLVEIPNIISGAESFSDIIVNGFVIYGAIIGGAGAAYIYCRVKKLSFIKHFDLIAPAIAVAQGIGRIGCLLAGCCYGAETSSKLSLVFPEGAFAPSGVHLHPTQIYSSLGDFAIAAVLFIFYARKKNRKDGQTAILYVAMYSIGRFFMEFLRGDARGEVGILSTSQFIAIILVVLCIAAYFVSKRITSKDAAKEEMVNEEAEEDQKLEPESDTKVIFDVNAPDEDKTDSQESENPEDKN
jgi:phosphatidylglycerol:prolipoprotein diacylglycerol transferase